jgi:patatin-like phospholipase/acyl hydrolase
MPKQKLKFLLWARRNWSKSANSQAALKTALAETFAETTLNDLWKKRGIGLCVTAVDLLTQHPRVFKTPHNVGKKKFRDNNWKLRDICLASAAAPVYFPIARLQDPDTPTHLHAFVDGGLWANNPTLIGLIEALEMAGTNQPIEIVSVGTCSPAIGKSLGNSPGNWGIWRWRAGTNVAETAMEASAHATDYAVQFLTSHLRTRCRILRLPQSSPSIEHQEDIGLDRSSARFIETMTSLGRHDADAIYGQYNRNQNNSPYQLLQDIFTSTLIKETHV